MVSHRAVYYDFGASVAMFQSCRLIGAPVGKSERMVGGRRQALWALVASVTLLSAAQVVAKAVRDSAFFSSFDASLLPTLIAGSAAATLVSAIVVARHVSSAARQAHLAWLYVFSAVLFAVEGTLIDAVPHVVTIVLFSHVTILIPFLISLVWSLVTDVLDLDTARRRMGVIAATASLGSVSGAVITTRVTDVAAWNVLLLALAVLHLLSGLGVGFVLKRHGAAGVDQDPDIEAGYRGWLRAMVDSPYPRVLGASAVLVSIALTGVDFVFRTEAAASIRGPEALTRFFLIFYVASDVLALIVQLSVTDRAVDRMGPARAVTVLPVSIVMGGLAIAMQPTLALATATRLVTRSLRNAFHRPGCEQLHGALRVGDRQSIKVMLDVGGEQIGRLAGGAVVALIVAGFGSRSSVGVMLLSAAAAAWSLWLIRHLRRHHPAALLDRLSTEWRGHSPRFRAGSSIASVGHDAPLLRLAADRVAALQSGDEGLVRQALEGEPLTRHEAIAAVPLIGWDPVADEALAALRATVDEISGHVVDLLLDGSVDIVIRRRIPRLLADASTRLAVVGLREALSLPEFELRFQSASALSRMRERGVDIDTPWECVLDWVRAEVVVSERIWRARRVLEHAGNHPFDMAGLDARVGRSLQHVFALLSFCHDQEPLRIAFHGIHGADQALKGVALEFLASILPRDVREVLWVLLGARLVEVEDRPTGDVVEELRRAHDSVRIKLSDLHGAS